MNTNTETQKQKKRRNVKTMLKWTAIAAGALIVLAVIVGVCNALFADGEWTFGWKNYRYDDSLYESGDATVPSDGITSIEIDWIDGIVQVIPCDDRYISLTEHAQTTLSDAATVRWNISADGSKLSVKYRASAWVLGDGSNKNLTLRVPRRLFAQLQSLTVTATSSDILLKELEAKQLSVNTESGDLRAVDCAFESVALTTKKGHLIYESTVCPSAAQIEFESGKVELCLPADVDLTLYWEHALTSDIPAAQGDGCYVLGKGSAQFRVTSKKPGELVVKVYSPK